MTASVFVLDPPCRLAEVNLAIAVAVPVALILKEPNLGTAMITAVVGGAVFLGAGVRWWKVVLLCGAIALAAPLAYEHLHDYQRARLVTFLNPESDPLEHRPKQPPRQVTLGQQEPAIPRVLDQAPPVLTRRYWRLVSDQMSIRAGSTSRRYKFPRV